MITIAISNVHKMFMRGYKKTSVIHHYILRNDAYITIESHGGGYEKFTITGPIVKHDSKERQEASVGITEVHVLYLSDTNDGTFAHHFVLKNNPYILVRTTCDVYPLLSIEGSVLRNSWKLWDPTSDDDYPIPVTNLLLEMTNG